MHLCRAALVQPRGICLRGTTNERRISSKISSLGDFYVTVAYDLRIAVAVVCVNMHIQPGLSFYLQAPSADAVPQLERELNNAGQQVVGL